MQDELIQCFVISVQFWEGSNYQELFIPRIRQQLRPLRQTGQCQQEGKMELIRLICGNLNIKLLDNPSSRRYMIHTKYWMIEWKTAIDVLPEVFKYTNKRMQRKTTGFLMNNKI